LKKSYERPKREELSEGERSTHVVGDAGEDLSTLDLMRQAVEYAEGKSPAQEEAQVFEIDEEGNAVPYEEQVEDLSAAMADTGTGETMEAEIPDPGVSEDLAVLIPEPPSEPAMKKPRFSDTAPTRPGVAPSEMMTEMGEALQLPEPITEEDEVLEIDSDDIIEVPLEVEMEVDHSSQAEVAATMEPQPRAEDIDADQFWGLSEAAPAAPLPPEPPTMPQQEKPVAPRHRPKKPLPALGVAPAPPPLRKEEKPAPRPAHPAPRRVDKKSIDALFDDAEIEASPGEELAPVSPARPRAAAPVVAGSSQPIDIAPGPRKATVHFKDGVTRRGVIGHFETDADLVRLDPPTGSSAPSEDLVALALKTIFLMLPRGADKPRVSGAPVRLVLIDGRSLEGTTNDYDPHLKAFTLFPKGARGNIERIIVYNDAVKNIWFE
jgi:hypothetical protein